MSVRAGLIQKLLATAAVTAIVGQAVFPAGRVPQGDALDDLMPPGWKQRDGERFITVQRTHDAGKHHHGGRVGQAFSAWQVNAWAGRPSLQDQLDDAVRDVLDGYQGPLGVVADCTVQKDDEFDITDPPTDGSGEGDHGTTFQFAITYPRTAA